MLLFLKRRALVVFGHRDYVVSMELEQCSRLAAGWRDGLMMDGRWMNGWLDGRHNLYLYYLLIFLYYFDTAQFQFSVLVFKQLSLID